MLLKKNRRKPDRMHKYCCICMSVLNEFSDVNDLSQRQVCQACKIFSYMCREELHNFIYKYTYATQQTFQSHSPNSTEKCFYVTAVDSRASKNVDKKNSLHAKSDVSGRSSSYLGRPSSISQQSGKGSAASNGKQSAPGRKGMTGKTGDAGKLTMKSKGKRK